ncbi:hypothetical protein [Leptolyngbya sp. FACHB-541]|uniref:hypothetical protein n=1 Tax=Leptolyngbya sp. FACHB-541 TaxID=2692810 RepID=UPI0016854B04|nr:hypothetical protein [Leptolyngbya sp. FACHB-541]
MTVLTAWRGVTIALSNFGETHSYFTPPRVMKEGYNERLQDVKEKLAAHNQARSLVDKTQNDLLEAERALNDYSEHMLLNVASRYGKNSNEYEMAGGTRKSDRRRSRTAVSKTIAPTS